VTATDASPVSGTTVPPRVTPGGANASEIAFGESLGTSTCVAYGTALKSTTVVGLRGVPPTVIASPCSAPSAIRRSRSSVDAMPVKASDNRPSSPVTRRLKCSVEAPRSVTIVTRPLGRTSSAASWGCMTVVVPPSSTGITSSARANSANGR
jgi:hypothetical protein